VGTFPYRPRKRRWLAVGIWFILGETGNVLAAYGYTYGLDPTFFALFFYLTGLMAFILIPPREKWLIKKTNPEAKA